MEPAVPLDPAEILALLEHHHTDAPVHRALAVLRAAASEDDRDDPVRLSMRELDRRLVSVRQRMYGERIDACTRCPGCAGVIELDLHASDLLTSNGDDGMAETLEAEGYLVRFRLPTCGDVAACIRRETGREDALLSLCIDGAERDGCSVGASDLPVRVRSTVADRLAALDDALLELAVECPWCERAFAVPFDITSYLWEELGATAAKLLDDVHLLAGAYGWTEAEILTLGPDRREAYVERVLQ